MALIPPYVHIVETASYVAGTSLTLTVTNSTNVGDGDFFIFRCPRNSCINYFINNIN